MPRRILRPLLLFILVGAIGFVSLAAKKPFSVVEATIPEMQKAMKEKRVTSRELVAQYLIRIGLYEDRLHAAIVVNPNAIKEAEALDRERAQGKVRGPLHGIPIALKDIIQTTHMPTSGGALVFRNFVPPYEATLTKNLREAGAIIIAKTSLTELANWVGAGMPTNYNAVSGFGLNPYDPRVDPRDANADGRPVLAPGGSSSGIGTSANLWAANVGTETSGSILNPSGATMLVGVKPTVGRISRYGVIPITADQDTPGPMAKSVTDAAILLGVLEGDPDVNDPATRRCAPPPQRDYTRFLKSGALKGARIGIPRRLQPSPPTMILAEVAEILKQKGATVVDPADLPSALEEDPQKNVLTWGVCAGPNGGKGNDSSCSSVFKYGMKRDFNRWLALLGPSSPVKTLTELREWNLRHERAGAIKYGQSQLDISDEIDLEADRKKYEDDRAKDIFLAGAHGIDEVMNTNRLDALVFVNASGALLAARPGYPSVIVPFGFGPAPAPESFPQGFNPKPAPVGVTFTGMACSEPRLLELAFAFEQATKRRVPPPEFP